MILESESEIGDKPEKGQGKRVILQMTEGLQGVTVTCDNFFTSHSLAQELLRKKIALVGTMRKNTPELPPVLLETKQRPQFSSIFAFTRNTTAVSYIRKKNKNVILISTKHREAATEEDDKQKPQMIKDYNRCKGGVDNLDKVIFFKFIPFFAFVFNFMNKFDLIIFLIIFHYFSLRLLAPTDAKEEQIGGHKPSSAICWTCQHIMPLFCSLRWSHLGIGARRPGGGFFLESWGFPWSTMPS